MKIVTLELTDGEGDPFRVWVREDGMWDFDIKPFFDPPYIEWMDWDGNLMKTEDFLRPLVPIIDAAFAALKEDTDA